MGMASGGGELGKPRRSRGLDPIVGDGGCRCVCVSRHVSASVGCSGHSLWSAWVESPGWDGRLRRAQRLSQDPDSVSSGGGSTASG